MAFAPHQPSVCCAVGGHGLAEARFEHPLEVFERGEAAFGADPA